MKTTKKQAKKSFAILLLIMLISSICGTAVAKSAYGGDIGGGGAPKNVPRLSSAGVRQMGASALSGSNVVTFRTDEAPELDRYQPCDSGDDLIDFQISVHDVALSSIRSATLTLAAWDVDYDCGYECCERDTVYINGHRLMTPQEYLTGASEQWSTVTFDVNPEWIVDGDNYVQIFINTECGWCAECDWGELALELDYCRPTLTKVDDVNDDNCVGPGREINYRIDYNYPAGPNCLDINDVNIIDELPEEVEPNNPFDPNYDPEKRTYTWKIGTLSPGESGFVTLKVKVKCAGMGSTIRNKCEIIRSGEQVLDIAYENTPACWASDPGPACGATDVPVDVVLSWRPGRYAADVNGHRVYLDADEPKVVLRHGCDINGVSTTDPYYPIPTPLELDRTYYWCIDEVNMAHEPNTWKGAVWHFRTRNYLIVEDFNSYADDDALRAVWKSSAQISLQPGANDANLVRDGNSMQYPYDNYPSPYYSEAYANTADLPSQVGSNWTISGVKALMLYFYGQADNDANEQMYVKLTDGDNPAHTATVMYDGDMNDIKKVEWQEWNIALTEFTDVNLANVARITIRFGDGIDPSPAPNPAGTVYFDDIRLYTRRCIPERPIGDLSGDCVVDWQDLKIMTDEWLNMGCCEADLYKDYKVNFKDFAILADNWLEEGLWP